MEFCRVKLAKAAYSFPQSRGASLRVRSGRSVELLVLHQPPVVEGDGVLVTQRAQQLTGVVIGDDRQLVNGHRRETLHGDIEVVLGRHADNRVGFGCREE